MQNLLKNSVCYVVLLCLSDSVGSKSLEPSGWIDVSRRMFVNAELTSMREIADAKPNATDAESMVSACPFVVYGALKCTYADAAVDLLQTFSEFVLRGLPADDRGADGSSLSDADERLAWLTETLKSLNGTKRLFARMIFALFHYADAYPKLMTSDQGLLKTLLSVNLFLYNSAKNQPFAGETGRGKSVASADKTLEDFVVLYNALVQMVDLIECFRCKHCLQVRDPYSNYFDVRRELSRGGLHYAAAAEKTLGPKIESLESLVAGNSPVDYSENYSDAMYDPAWLSLRDLVHGDDNWWLVVASANIRYADDEIGFGNLLGKEEIEFDLGLIFDFQNLLFEIIADVFFRQVYESMVSRKITRLRVLMINYQNFVEHVIPINCSTTVCRHIVFTKKIIKLYLDQYQSKTSHYTDKQLREILNDLKESFNDDFWDSEDTLKKVNRLKLWFLIHSIRDSEQLISFNQVAKLLSYESNTNRNHHLHKVSDMPKKYDNMSTEAKTVIQHTYELRLTLLLFSLYLQKRFEIHGVDDADKNDDVVIHHDNGVRDWFLCTSHYVINLYRSLKIDHRDIQKIIFPLLIHFRNIQKSFLGLTKLDFVKLYQVLLLTINVIEIHLFHEYKWVINNLVIYTVHIMNIDQVSHVKSSLKLLKEIRGNCGSKDSDVINTYLNGIYNLYFHSEFLPYSDQLIVFYWNGANTFVYEILKNMNLSRTINDLQDLVRYRLLTIKWFFAKVLTKLKYILKNRYNAEFMGTEGAKIRNSLKTFLSEFVNLKLPMDAEYFIQDTTEYLALVLDQDTNRLDENAVENCESFINRNLLLLGVVSQDITYASVKIALNNLNIDIKYMEKLLASFTNEDENMLMSKDNTFMTALFPAKIIH